MAPSSSSSNEQGHSTFSESDSCHLHTQTPNHILNEEIIVFYISQSEHCTPLCVKILQWRCCVLQPPNPQFGLEAAIADSICSVEYSPLHNPIFRTPSRMSVNGNYVDNKSLRYSFNQFESCLVSRTFRQGFAFGTEAGRHLHG